MRSFPLLKIRNRNEAISKGHFNFSCCTVIVGGIDHIHQTSILIGREGLRSSLKIKILSNRSNIISKRRTNCQTGNSGTGIDFYVQRNCAIGSDIKSRSLHIVVICSEL
ncbi:hypothetical protein D3C81_1107290 [compost metagenome]